MKKKKLLVSVLALALGIVILICCLIGCRDAAVKVSPVVDELNMTQDGITEGNHEFDHKNGGIIDLQWFTDESVEKSMNVVFNGQEYECSYLWSVIFPFYNYRNYKMLYLVLNIQYQVLFLKVFQLKLDHN